VAASTSTTRTFSCASTHTKLISINSAAAEVELIELFWILFSKMPNIWANFIYFTRNDVNSNLLGRLLQNQA